MRSPPTNPRLPTVRYALVVLAVAIHATPVAAEETARERLVQLTGHPDAARISASLVTTNRMPRAAFMRGEVVALDVAEPDASVLFGLLIDSHGAPVLLGEAGGLPSPAGDAVPVVDGRHWEQGLPWVPRTSFSSSFRRVNWHRSPNSLDTTKASSSRRRCLRWFLGSRSAGRAHLERICRFGDSSGRRRDARRGWERERRLPDRFPRRDRRLFTGPRTRALERPRLDVYVHFDTNESDLGERAKAQVRELGAALQNDRIRSRSFVLAAIRIVAGHGNTTRALRTSCRGRERHAPPRVRYPRRPPLDRGARSRCPS